MMPCLITFIIRLVSRSDKEVLSKNEIISKFQLNKLSSSAIFDFDKLEWMNGVYINYSNEKIIHKVIPILESKDESIGLPKSVKRPLDKKYLVKIVPLVKKE